MYLLLIWKTAESIVWLFHTPWTVWMDWRPGLWMLPFHSRGLKDLLVMRSYTNHLKSYMDRYQHHVVCTCTKIMNLNVIRNQNEFLIIFPSINCMHLKQQKKKWLSSFSDSSLQSLPMTVKCKSISHCLLKYCLIVKFLVFRRRVTYPNDFPWIR